MLQRGADTRSSCIECKRATEDQVLVSVDLSGDEQRYGNTASTRKIDAILVTELTRWGRSMLDLFRTLQELQSWSALNFFVHDQATSSANIFPQALRQLGWDAS